MFTIKMSLIRLSNMIKLNRIENIILLLIIGEGWPEIMLNGARLTFQIIFRSYGD